jgi:predicted heme/steroid binding protein
MELTRAELSRCDGKEGRPAYIGCNGTVYDATASFHWRGGRHHALHGVGADLTDSLASAPHGPHLLERLPVVGTLQEGEEGSPAV